MSLIIIMFVFIIFAVMLGYMINAHYDITDAIDRIAKIEDRLDDIDKQDDKIENKQSINK